MNSVVLPTFRRSAFRRPPRSLQAPWGPGMPGTHYVLQATNTTFTYRMPVQP